MCTNDAQAYYLHRSGRVERWHTAPHLTRQTNAEHAWGVAALITALHPAPSAALLMAALTHDAGEAWTGDIPASAKMRFPALRDAARDAEDKARSDLIEAPELSDDERAWLKACDRMDAYLYADHEVKLGNTYAQDLRRAISADIRKCTQTPEEVLHFLSSLDSIV